MTFYLKIRFYCCFQEGMGSLKIVGNGVYLDGEAYLMDRLVASNIRSRAGRSLTFEAARNLTIHARKSDARVANKLFLGDGKLECEAATFKITSPLGKELFSADQRQVHVGAATLRVSGDGGAVFDGSIQTPLVRAEARHELLLESPTRSVEVTAAEGIALESRAGDIAATCLTELRLTSKEGAIHLNSGNIMLQKLPIVNVTSASSMRTSALVYQMCICGDGKIFMVPPSWECVADARICS
ncbi:unnamed protein product [Notodromas monacha]|uniref:Zeta-sarcoglycan n=1 Tax=Notodromas monacha TaxID=399045 RepID=A0A7R9BGY0_9CRUS|nr:unnamed protein product [Notodromas monacha]CAG0913953.1 unnamed protein product [Notodromas monacha]